VGGGDRSGYKGEVAEVDTKERWDTKRGQHTAESRERSAQRLAGSEREGEGRREGGQGGGGGGRYRGGMLGGEKEAGTEVFKEGRCIDRC
jgi:hypothetical protein